MVTVPRLLAVVALVVAATTAAAAQPGPAPGSRAWVESLKPQWSRPVGGKTKLVGVEEYGRCSVFIDKGMIQVVSPSGEVLWTWPLAKVSKYTNPQDVAVAHDCDAVAFVGDATRKYVWIADRTGALGTIPLTVTPAAVEFDRTGEFIAVGSYTGSLLLYSINGGLQWQRDTRASIVQGIAFSDDNQRITFESFAGEGVVSVAGHLEWSNKGSTEPDVDPAPPPLPDYRWLIAASGDGKRMWLRGEDTVDCVDDRGTVLATISATPTIRGVRVSRDFAQVLVITEKDLRPVSVERYEINAPCKP